MTTGSCQQGLFPSRHPSEAALRDSLFKSWVKSLPARACASPLWAFARNKTETCVHFIYFRCVLESMKMEMVLSAPQDCVVKQWFVAAGDAVAEGQVPA